MRKRYSEEYIEQMWTDIEMCNTSGILYTVSRNNTGVFTLETLGTRTEEPVGRADDPSRRKAMERAILSTDRPKTKKKRKGGRKKAHGRGKHPRDEPDYTTGMLTPK
jgi:hypothetical protein